jgi:hypothetical protein
MASDRDTTFAADLASEMEGVARSLLGEPNRALSTRRELRFGRKGSLSVNIEQGTFFDHEIGEGGGVLDLIKRETGLSGRDAFEWLERGFGVALDSGQRQGRPERPRSTPKPPPTRRRRSTATGGVSGARAGRSQRLIRSVNISINVAVRSRPTMAMCVTIHR